MVEVGCIPNSFSGRKELKWEHGSLQEFIHTHFGVPGKLNNERVKLERLFVARNLERITGISIFWTNNLADHLRMMEHDTQVAIFHHASFLEMIRTSLAECQASTIFPEGFIGETLRTLALLFPQSDVATRKWFLKLRKARHLDMNAIKCGQLRAEDRQIETFRFWRDRIVILKQVFDEAEPNTWSQWWSDLDPYHIKTLLTMSTKDLTATLQQLQSHPSPHPEKISTLLSTAKRQLLQLNALLPTPSTSPHILHLARETLETGALLSIRLQNIDAFTRYFQQLAPFYELPASSYSPPGEGQRSKVTGLYLLLLLTKGDYAEFHTVLEGLETEVGGERGKGSKGLEEDKFIGYPVKLERWLMEGSYDRVWKAVGREGVPSEEFGVFSEVLIGTIRSEIASCSEKAYASLPVPNAKNLLFLDSEGGVVEFARSRRWVVKDGRIWFPLQQGEEGRTEKDILVASEQVIENAIGYARELETIV
ncbi:MAG: hypothetical protein Q9163_004187 [Psora crenata]